MIFLYVGTLLFCLMVMIRSRGRPEVYLYKKGLWIRNKLKKAPVGRKASVVSDFQILYPFDSPQEKVTAYYLLKVKQTFRFVVAGSAIATLLWVQGANNGELLEGNQILRGSYGEGYKRVELRPIFSKGEDRTDSRIYEIQVEEQKYTQKELDELFVKSLPVLEKTILGANESLNDVNQPLQLVQQLEGFPFTIRWEISNYRLLGADGEPGEDVAPEGETVQLIASYTYFTYRQEYEFYARIYPRERTPEEQWEQEVLDAIAGQDLETQYEQVFTLPTQIGTVAVEWIEEKENYSLGLFMLFLIAGITLFFARDRELHQQIQKRQQELLCDYPAILSKLTLYLGAGLTVRGACHRVVKDYEQAGGNKTKKRYAYEELSFACHEMDNGVSEAVAYEQFARRCGQNCYSKLAALLSQNSKKGNSNLLQQLRTESEHAQEERRNLARKMGEEAGTRLLLPMMLLLVMVMLMILVPAMLSFGI